MVELIQEQISIVDQLCCQEQEMSLVSVQYYDAHERSVSVASICVAMTSGSLLLELLILEALKVDALMPLMSDQLEEIEADRLEYSI